MLNRKNTVDPLACFRTDGFKLPPVDAKASREALLELGEIRPAGLGPAERLAARRKESVRRVEVALCPRVTHRLPIVAVVPMITRGARRAAPPHRFDRVGPIERISAWLAAFPGAFA